MGADHHLCPDIEIGALTAVVDHSIDGTGATDDFALRYRNRAPVQPRGRFRPERPDKAVAIQRLYKPRRYPDEGMAVVSAGLKYTDARIARLAQTIGQDTTRGTGTNYDVVE